MVINVTLTQIEVYITFGSGYLLYAILRFDGCSSSVSLRSACLWLFNPVAFAVSTRGNAEAILSALVLAVLLLVKKGVESCDLRVL